MDILVVDDEESATTFYAGACEALGLQKPDVARTGEEALARVVQKSYGMITLDIRMPGASGLEVIALVRNMCPHAIIALISGHFPDRVSEDTGGCADVMLEKPVSLDTFCEVLRRAAQIDTMLKEVRNMSVIETTPLTLEV